MLRFVEVAIGNGGRTGCVRCTHAVAPSMRPAEQIVAEIDRITSTWADEPGPNVIFRGAEPFVHPELPAVITAAAQAGCERIAVSTDAGALSLPQNASGALSAGVTHVEVTILGGRETHDVITGHAGLFDAAVSGVAAFKNAAEKSGVPVFVWGAVPVCAHNIAHISEAVVALVSVGAGAVMLDASSLGVVDEGQVALLRAAVETATVNGIAACVLNSTADFDPPLDRMPVSVEEAPL